MISRSLQEAVLSVFANAAIFFVKIEDLDSLLEIHVARKT